jgi:hypothetical protein
MEQQSNERRAPPAAVTAGPSGLTINVLADEEVTQCGAQVCQDLDVVLGQVSPSSPTRKSRNYLRAAVRMRPDLT